MIEMSNKNEPKRVTYHNGRKGTNGVYNPSHNDRKFKGYDKNDSENVYFCLYENMSFEDAEQKFYEDYFSKGLEDINAKHKKSRNYKRMKTMEQYRKSEKTCPEETLYYIGKSGNSADPKELWDIVREQLLWQNKTFPQIQILNAALHVDENGACHIHERHVYMCHNENGNYVVGQENALNEMGIYAPDTSKKTGHYNNAKMTYTKMVREHFTELCKQHGYEIIEKPKESSKTGLSMWQYIKDEQESEIKEKQLQIVEENEKMRDFRKQVIQKSKSVTQREFEILEREKGIQEQKDDLQKQFDKIDEIYKTLSEAQKNTPAVKEAYSSYEKLKRKKEKNDRSDEEINKSIQQIYDSFFGK